MITTKILKNSNKLIFYQNVLFLFSSPTRIDERLRDLRPPVNPPPPQPKTAPPQPKVPPPQPKNPPPPLPASGPRVRPDITISPRKPETPPNFMHIQRGKSFLEVRCFFFAF